jgi:hypothetical protein
MVCIRSRISKNTRFPFCSLHPFNHLIFVMSEAFRFYCLVFGRPEDLPWTLLDLLYFTTYSTLRGTIVLILYLLGFSVLYAINSQYLSLLLPKFKMLLRPWSVIMTGIIHSFTWFSYTTLVGDFLSGRGHAPRAPTFLWAVLWSVAISFIGCSSTFLCGYGSSVVFGKFVVSTTIECKTSSSTTHTFQSKIGKFLGMR